MTVRMAASKTMATGVGTSGPRRLVLMFDGTWNDRHSLTNVARMYEAIDDYNPYRRKSGYNPEAEGNEEEEKAINEKAAKAFHELADKSNKVDVHLDDAALGTKDLPRVQLVRYIPGVGTDAFGKISGGVAGYGLSEKIKEGYLWLSRNFRSGDDIFVFGFSRGAYAARSLVSFVHRCGGVMNLKNGAPALEFDPSLNHWRDQIRDHIWPCTGADLTDRLLDRMYDLYAAIDNPDEIPPKIAEDCRQYKRYCQSVTIKMLGVWDTVGSLGFSYPLVPQAIADHMLASRACYKFHESQELPCIVENAYHALAIDEMRADFRPTLWEKLGEDPDRPRATVLKGPDGKEVAHQPVKQVWFVGSHSNVGGGAIRSNSKKTTAATKSEDRPGGLSQYSYADEDRPDDLWQYSYVWMQDKAEALGLRFFWKYNALGVENDTSNVFSLIDGSKRQVSWTQPLDSLHEMAHGRYERLRPHAKEPRDVAHLKGIHTSLHWSVKERIAMDDEYRNNTMMLKFENVDLITSEPGLKDGEKCVVWKCKDIDSQEPPTGSDKHICSCRR